MYKRIWMFTVAKRFPTTDDENTQTCAHAHQKRRIAFTAIRNLRIATAHGVQTKSKSNGDKDRKWWRRLLLTFHPPFGETSATLPFESTPKRNKLPDVVVVGTRRQGVECPLSCPIGGCLGVACRFVSTTYGVYKYLCMHYTRRLRGDLFIFISKQPRGWWNIKSLTMKYI